MQAFGLTEFIPFIYAPHVSGSILFPSSPCFLHFPSPSAITVVAGSIRWIAVWGGLIHIWRPEITDVCDISHLLIWQEIFSFHSLFSFTFRFFFSAICMASPDNHFALLPFFYVERFWSPPPIQCYEPLSIVLQVLYQIQFLESICHFHCIIIKDLF